MAGSRQPIDLVVAKGKKHLTKEEIEARKNQEISVPFLDIEVPKYLTGSLKMEFIDIAKKLKAINIMTELDEDCLGRYLLSKKNYIKMTKKLNSEMSKSIKEMDISEIERLTSIQDRLFKQCRASASDLGLSISSRCKLVLPPTPPPKKQNKFDKFNDND